jgi:hypothetical protein
VYREDLKQHPENGWSLFGLWRSLGIQGKTREAATIEERFHKAWSRAGVILRTVRLSAPVAAENESSARC